MLSLTCFQKHLQNNSLLMFLATFWNYPLHENRYILLVLFVRYAYNLNRFLTSDKETESRSFFFFHNYNAFSFLSSDAFSTCYKIGAFFSDLRTCGMYIMTFGPYHFDEMPPDTQTNFQLPLESQAFSVILFKKADPLNAICCNR